MESMKDSSVLNRTHFTGKGFPGMLFIFVVALFLSALTGCTRQRIYENLYEGIRVRNELQTPPRERGEQQSYWQYQNSLRSGDPEAP